MGEKTNETPAAEAPVKDGIVEAVRLLREKYDEEATVLWRTAGARNSRVEAIASVVVTRAIPTNVEGVEPTIKTQRILVVGFESGAFRIYEEATSFEL
jgi:hypothetical protein